MTSHVETAAPATTMNRRQVLEALSGLLLGLFVTILSSTVVSAALPRIVSELGGSQSAYTWVVTASLLSMTVSTPIWGKLADLFSRKLLVQVALVLFVVGSALAGLSQDASMLIGFRVLQGLGAGGLTALSQVIIADIISPRERGRYMGFLGAVMAVGTVAGPLLGGVLTDSSLGWRSTFYVGVPFAVVALAVLQKTLHLPRIRREVSIDYLGAILLSGGVATLMIWVTLAGNEFAWASRTTAVLVGGGVVLLLLAVLVESRAKEPILPLWLFKNRTFVFAVLASVAVGIVMFGTSVFLSQYMQLARGKTPTETGLVSIPMAIGSLVSATVVGQIITRTGRWKRWMVLGGLLLIAGAVLMGTIDYQTTLVLVCTYMLVLGLGVGMCMQNLVLAVQNTVSVTEMGAASAGVAFFRSMGGAVGVSVLGAVLADRVASSIRDGLAELGVRAPSLGGAVPDLSTLPAPVRTVVERAYGEGVAEIFLVAAPVAVLALIAILAIREVPLGTRSGIEERLAMEAAAAGAEPPADEPAADAADLARLDLETSRTEPVLVGANGAAASVPAAGASTEVRATAGVPVTAGVPAASANGSRPGDLAAQADLPAQTELAGYRSAQANGAHRLDPAVTDLAAGTAPEPRASSTGPGATPEPALPVRGTVRRPDGLPVHGAALTLINLGGHQVGRASTDEQGGFALTAQGAGTYVLITSATSYQPRASTVVVDTEPVTVDVVLTGVNGLVGQVRAADGGAPVQGAVAVLADARGEVVAAQTTGVDGALRFGDLGPGTYTLAVRAEGYRPVALSVQVAGAGETRQDVELVARATLRGTTRTRDGGRPIPDARVTLVNEAGEVVGVTHTDEDGAYTFDDLVLGEYTVIATGYPAVASAAVVTGGEVTTHDVELGYPEI